MAPDGAIGSAYRSGAEAEYARRRPVPPPNAMQATPFFPDLSPVLGKPIAGMFNAGRLSSGRGLVVVCEIAMWFGRDGVNRPLDKRDRSRGRRRYTAMALARRGRPGGLRRC